MSIVINAIRDDGKKEAVEVFHVPDSCPRCHCKIQPLQTTEGFLAEPDLLNGPRLQIVFRCPNRKCLSLFIGTYYQQTRHSHYFALHSAAPYKVSIPEFSDSIREVSESFCQIYGQAYAAAQWELDQVCGVGYRKALEFLIKDYAISVEASKEKEIKSSPLGKCIERYVDDPRIKSCAARATWLGNDETHYTRRWVDKDLSDLKILIELTVNWIQNVKLTEKYESAMNGNPRTT